MDVDADEPLAVVPGLLDLVVDPLATGGLATDEHDARGPSSHLAIDPTPDSRVALPLDGLPVVGRQKALAFDHPHLTNLLYAPVVALEMERMEDAACHSSDSFR